MEDFPPLDATKRDAVMELFKMFDVLGDGKIPLDRLKGAKMMVGPAESSVLKKLAEMDFNQDGYVEASEWELYFTAIYAQLTDEEVKLVMDDLAEAGRCHRHTCCVHTCTCTCTCTHTWTRNMCVGM